MCVTALFRGGEADGGSRPAGQRARGTDERGLAQPRAGEGAGRLARRRADRRAARSRAGRRGPRRPPGGAVPPGRAGRGGARRGPGRLPLVLGGDCTITLGALDGFGEGGLVYFDGDADLTTPERSGSAVADTMGMTHMLGGGSPRLARLGSRYPLLRPGQVVLFGFDPAELDTA